MKKVVFIFSLLILIMNIATAQPQLTFRLANPDLITGDSTVFAFDVQVKASVNSSFHRDLQIYLDYNSLAFGEDVVNNQNLSISQRDLLSQDYNFVNIADNTSSKIAIITENKYEFNETGNSGYFLQIPAEFTNLLQIKIEVVDESQPAGISFDEGLMNCGQYAQAAASTEPIAYTCPSLYANDWSNLSIPGQTLELAKGWSGISSYIEPLDADVETLFSKVVGDLVILKDLSNIFYPAQNINTIGSWDYETGYTAKMINSHELKMNGFFVDGYALELHQNWNLIPVLSECLVDVTELFFGIDPMIVKEVAGTRIYWPEFGINTLGVLQPGKAYFVKMESSTAITFPECDGMKSTTIKFEDALSGSSYRPLLSNSPTANTHSIAVSSTNLTGFCRAYDDEGNSFGAGELSENYITLFGDDPLTEEKDGFYENDHIMFTWIDADSGAEQKLQVSFDPSLPDHDGTFSSNGLSAIKLLSVGSTLVSNRSDNAFEVYPNPADKTLYVEKTMDGAANISIISIQGTEVYNQKIVGSKTEIDVSALPAGIYFVKLSSEKATAVKRVVVK